MPRPTPARPGAAAVAPADDRAAFDGGDADERPRDRASAVDCVLVAALCVLASVTLYRLPGDARDARTVASASEVEASFEVPAR